MKKVIVFTLVLAMAVGSAFAVDIGGTVFGGVNLMEGNSEDDDIRGSLSMKRVRFEGSGGAEANGMEFGGFLRFEGGQYGGATISTGNGYDVPGLSALAWWQPVDAFKMSIGGNPDGFYGKEGFAGWMFYQMPCDVGIADNGSVWGYGDYHPSNAYIFRSAFYGGFDGNALMFDIKPIDMLGINIVLPYASHGLLEDIFKGITAQVDLNFDFGNIAVTFAGDGAGPRDNPAVFAYFGLSAIDNLSLDVGLGFSFSDDDNRSDPIGIGLAAKVDVSDSFGFKARLFASVGGGGTIMGIDYKDPTVILFDVLPYIGINDSMKVYIGAGLTVMAPDEGDALIGWYFNPYLTVGAEWGPTFLAGIRVWSNGNWGDPLTGDGSNYNVFDDKATVSFAIPIGIQVSF
jgi:hypothetical protein